MHAWVDRPMESWKRARMNPLRAVEHAPMRKIIVASQKGGAGKSTLCAHLSVQAERAGDGPAYLIDTDPQASLSTWHERREAETPRRVEVPLEEVGAGLEVLRKRGAGLVMIDTAPSRSEEVAQLFQWVDMAVIPVRASPADLWAVGATVSQLKEMGIPFVFVLNGVKPNAAITAQAVAALSHHGKVIDVFVADRTAYAASMVNGRTAIELAPKGPAAQEISQLWERIKACIPADK